MSYALTETARALHNLIRLAKITEVDHAAYRARAAFGENETAFLPWLENRAGANVTHSAPEVGEQVIILCPSGEPANGIILRGLYSDSRTPPEGGENLHAMTFKDGASVKYDTASGKLTVEAITDIEVTSGADITINATGSVTVNAPNTQVNGNLGVAGNIGTTGEGGGAGSFESTGNYTLNGDMTVNGDITATGVITAGVDVIGGGISLKSHIHPGDSGGNTGAAV